MISPSFSTRISRVVILIGFSLRFRISGVTQVRGSSSVPFLPGTSGTSRGCPLSSSRLSRVPGARVVWEKRGGCLS